MDLDLELLASIASGGLGSWQTDAAGRSVYVKSDDCIGCLRDLQRFFRNDDPEGRPAFFAVSKYNFARSDLVPLIVTYPDDYDVIYNALKVATFLTMPSSDPLVTTNRAQQEQHMQAVREAFLAQDALAAVVGMLAEPLARHPRMDERDAALVQLVMAFLRNLVAIPDGPAAPGPLGASAASKDAMRRIQSGLLDRLFSDNVMDLLLLLAQHAQQRPFRNEAPVLVETFMHIFSGVDPLQLLDAQKLLEKEQQAQREQEAAAKRAAVKAAQKAAQQAQRAGHSGGAAAPHRGGPAGRAVVANMAHLPRLPALPPAARQQLGAGVAAALARGVVPRHVTQAAPSRHAHSGAVYVRRHSEHSANIVVRHNPNRSELPRLPAVVDDRKAAAQRKDGPGGSGATAAAAAKPRLGAELLVRLDAFLQQFLDGGYDLLMGHVFKELQPGLNISRLAEADFLHFVRLATYCTRYVRLREERNLQAKLQQKVDKAKAAAAGDADSTDAAAAASPAAAAAAAAAGSSEQAEAGDEEEKEGASPFAAISATMGWDCFHWVTFLWITLSNIEGGGKQKDHGDKNWDLQHASVPLLKEMLLTLDLARVAGNAPDQRAADRLQRRLLHDDLKESGLLPVLARLIKGYNFRFQPRSHAVDLIETLHVVLGMLDRLSSAEPGGFKVKAAARRGGGGWRRKQPADGGEGEGGDGGEGQGSPGGSSGEGSPGSAKGGDAGGDDELAERRGAVGRSGDPLEEEEEERARRATREVSFQAAKRIRAELAHPAVLHFYTWLLQGYRTNSSFTNHAVVSLFRRIAEPQQQNLEPMLWQISILRLFEAVLSDVSIKRSAAHADLLAFAKSTVRNMFARMVPDLSELRQKASALEAELQGVAQQRAAARAAGREDDEVDSSEREKQRQLRMARAELKARENASNVLFMELLFWKAAPVAEDVRNEYNWIGLVNPTEHRRRGGRRGRGTALGDDDASDGEEKRFFETFRPREKKGTFNEDQAAALRAEFERCNGHKDCLDRLVFEFGGEWKKAHISRQLKAMGLAKGKFTEAQEGRMRELYEEHRGKLECFELITEQIGAGFTANQVKRHLRKIGVVAGAGGKGEGGKSGRKSKGAFTEEQEQQLRDLFDEHSSRHDRFEKIAEGMGMEGLTAAKVKRQLRKMGAIASRLTKRQRDAAFDLLVGGSDDEQGSPREGPQGSQQQSAGGSAGGGSASDASSSGSDGSDGSDSDSDSDGGSGCGSAREELAGSRGEGSDAGGSGGQQGGGRVQARAARRLQALAALQKKGKGGRKRQPQQRSPEQAGGAALGPASDTEGDDEENDGIAAQQAAAAAATAAGASLASSGGGSFVSLADSDAEGEEAAAEPAAKAAKRQRLQKPAPAKRKSAPAAAAAAEDSDSDAEGGSGSDGGFASARESEPESEAEQAAPAKQAGKKHARRQVGAASEEEEAEQEGQRQQSKKARRSRAAAEKQPGGTPGGKRKAEQPAGPSSAQKRAALDALRRRRQQAAGAAADAAEQDDGRTVGPAPTDENAGPQQQEAPAPAPAAAKPAGRRLLKKAGGSAPAVAAAPAAAPASLFEDLEDF
ncbi:hypothetical protein ABPG75_008536 [Micractinium tetrahymenae]